MIAIALVDDDPTVRAGLPEQIHRASDTFDVIGAFRTVEELLTDDRADEVVVVLLDILRGEGRLNSDLTALKQLNAKIVIITVDTTGPEIVFALNRHPVSIVHKQDLIEDAELSMVITQVARGTRIVDQAVQSQLSDDRPLPKLTRRQEDVLWEVVKGLPTKRIAEELHIEPPSVQDLLEAIEQRFSDAGHPIRQDGEQIRDRGFRLREKAKEIGYFTRKPRD